MTFTMTIWFASALIMLVLVFLGKRQASRVMSADVPENLGQFVRETLVSSIDRFSHRAKIIKPHVDRVTSVFLYVGKKSHDKFINNVFGKSNGEPGTASSFFLKHIAEHKAESKKEGEGKSGY